MPTLTEQDLFRKSPKLPGKLTAIASPVRKALRSQFHTLLYKARQQRGLRVFALGQRLRRFADHVATTAGTANGKRVRQWFQEKLRREAAWRNVVTPEGIQVPSESLGLSIIGHSMM
jgi:hypothetical protein